MANETIFPIFEQTCARAVKKFANQVTCKTAVELKVEEVSEQMDIEFLDEAPVKTTLSIKWEFKQLQGSAPRLEWKIADYEDENETNENVKSISMVRHYLKMLQVLAKNPEAARAFLRKTTLAAKL
jgi:hypothetical protein